MILIKGTTYLLKCFGEGGEEMCIIVDEIREEIKNNEFSMKDGIPPNYSQVEEFALKLTRYFHQSSYPIDIMEVARELGFDVRQGPIANAENENSLSSILAIDPALKDKEFKRSKVILVDNDMNNYKQVFAIAYCIGRYIFTCDNDKKYYYKYYRDEKKGTLENIINRFAAAVLMPKEMFTTVADAIRDKYPIKYDMYNFMAETFQVSTEGIRLRFIEIYGAEPA